MYSIEFTIINANFRTNCNHKTGNIWHLIFLSDLFFTFKGNKTSFLNTDRNLTKKCNVSKNLIYRNKFQILVHSNTEHTTEKKNK